MATSTGEDGPSRLLRSFSKWDRAGWLLVGLALLLSLCLPIALRLASPTIAVSASYDRDLAEIEETLTLRGVPTRKEEVGEDPWGNPYVDDFFEDVDDGSYAICSRGPNGRDEGGRGDDVVIYPPFRDPTLVGFLLGWSRELLLGFATLLSWCLALPRAWKHRAPDLRRDVFRSLGVALPPAVGVSMTLHWARRQEWWGTTPIDLQSDLPLVPLPVATFGTILLLCFLVALFVRLGRPLPVSADDYGRVSSTDADHPDRGKVEQEAN